jgi:N-acetylglucosaminyldiphosphoundecaprenol N-acetyl-beta-D-mannosaminyltransferase
MQNSVPSQGRRCESVLGVQVDVLAWTEAVDRIFAWALRRESRSVYICNVHSIVTARRVTAHAIAINSADMTTPDGAPVAWMLRRKGHRYQERICGPDLMSVCCRRAAATNTEIFLYGGTPATLRRLEQRLRREFDGINIVGTYSPPFRELSPDEDAAVVDMINRSGARLVWIGLGCPKQEAWMHCHRNRVNAVMVGVGAAFDFLADVARRAPPWMQRNGLEWLYRLVHDPRRLAKRYLMGNSIFIVAALVDLLFVPRNPTPIGDIDAAGKPSQSGKRTGAAHAD